ncbi:hypothetical protein J3R83DRAFT_13378 [Lanmaoa asiatica]|nr:hypothetical protein J3R83DRAFT_13378 [Lanmaoa asiatica]
MGRARNCTRKYPQPLAPESPKKAPSRRRRVPSPEKSLKVIEQLREAGKEAHLKARNTKKCYTGHVKRGREWLTGHFPAGSDSKLSVPEDLANEDIYTDPSFRAAFDQIPNHCSDKALSLFLTFKGFHQNLGKGTVEGIRAAFKHLWDNVDGDRYRGRWHFNLIDQRWEGNPADSAEVEDLMSSLKHKASSEDGDRTHSLPMTKDFMDSMLAWSLKSCPQIEAALCVLQRAFSGERVTASDLQMDLKEREFVSRHLEQLAFNATAWTLWTRQLVKVKWHDIMLLDPSSISHTMQKFLAREPLVLSDLSTYFEVHLRNCKGWQHKVDKGLSESDLRGNYYRIYPQPDLPGSDCFVWLLVWAKWLEVFHYGRELERDDYVFPAMGANGVMQPREPLSHNTIQRWINEATTGATIRGSFSTHCFRRGGAQYHFMFAPIGQHWPLAKVRWWGGWAEQERRDTLIRYLLDELHTYETDYSDALAPVPHNADNSSLMGEATLIQPVTTEELRSVHTSVTTDVRGLRARMDTLTSAVRELSTVVSNSSHTAGRAPAVSSKNPTPLTIRLPPPSRNIPWAPGPESAATGSSVPLQTPSSAISRPHARCASAPYVPISQSPSINTLGHASIPPGIPGGSRTGPTRRSSHRLPKAGLVIPDVPVLCADGMRRPRKESWRDIVQHWTTGDPALGLHTPLKDWPPEWIQGANRIFATKHFEWSVIALEFLHSDEVSFLTAYPQAERGHTALLHAINAARRERGERAVRPSRDRRRPNGGPDTNTPQAAPTIRVRVGTSSSAIITSSPASSPS